MSDSSERKINDEAEAARLLGEALPSEMAQAAGTFRECFESWVGVGFTERQSLWLAGCMLQGPGKPPTSDE